MAVLHLKRLELQEGTLRRELSETLKQITEDTRKRATGDVCLDAEERQKLANRSVDIRSKLLRIQDEIGTREIVKKDRSSREIRSRIAERYAAAARRHNRLLWTTIELERMKEDENAIRAIARDEEGKCNRERQRSQSLPFQVTDNVKPGQHVSAETMFEFPFVKEGQRNSDVQTISPTDYDDFAKYRIASATSRISTTSLRHSTKELDLRALERQDHLEQVRQTLSSMDLNNPKKQLEKADALKRKYELQREMRNLAHGQMISRPNRNSYWSINPPYRRKRNSMVHVRRSYEKDFYENKIDMVEAKDKKSMPFTPKVNVLKAKRRKKDDSDLGRYTMTSGRTISVRKMKDFTPPGMILQEEKLQESGRVEET